MRHVGIAILIYTGNPYKVAPPRFQVILQGGHWLDVVLCGLLQQMRSRKTKQEIRVDAMDYVERNLIFCCSS